VSSDEHAPVTAHTAVIPARTNAKEILIVPRIDFSAPVPAKRRPTGAFCSYAVLFVLLVLAPDTRPTGYDAASMPRDPARFVVLFALALVFVLRPARAIAQGAANPDEVSILTPPPVPASPSGAADVRTTSADLTRFLGQTIGTVTWSSRTTTGRRPADHQRHAHGRHAHLVRRTSRHGRGRRERLHRRCLVTVLQEPSGLHVTARRAAQGRRLDPASIHGTPLDEGEPCATPSSRARTSSSRGHPRAQAPRRAAPAPRVSGAQVNVTTRPTDDPLRVILILDISPGAPRKIERRVVYPLRGTKEEVDDAEKHYGMKSGQRADEFVLAAADAALEGRIRARGHHRAEVSHDVVLHRGLVVLRVRVDFGTRYDTRYEGNDH
jgi:hypothetical protein